METKEKVQDILLKFNLNNYAYSCKGMTIREFELFTIDMIGKFESEIKSFKPEDENILEPYVQELSRIRVFYNKALNYVKTKCAKMSLQKDELELLDKIYTNIKR